jgi:PAS domain S-box-containing protein
VDCPDIGEPVYVDRDMWEKIVLNLLSNAFKFTFDGEIRLSVSRVGNTAELRVQDTGVGIPPDAVPRLFERFHRVPNTRSRTHEGSGIGLALVNELIKLHGGSIQVESAVEQGSTFIVSIPLGQDHLPAGQVGGASNTSSTAIGASAFVEEALKWLPDEPSTDAVLSISGSEGTELVPMPQHAVSDSADRARILVADDNSDMRQYLTRLLGEQYEVETVADGQSAINAARQRPPSLILSDVMMPVTDGFELLKAIRADETTRTIPIMLLSARAGEESRIEGLQAGADDYLVKPFSARELVARVSARLEIARLQRENEHRVAVDLKAMSRLLEVGNLCVRPETQIEQCLDEFVAAAIDLTEADKGNLQLLDPELGILRIRAQRGFDEPFLKFFAAVRDDSSACGTAMGSGTRVDVEDVTESNIFKGHPSLDIMLQAGARAVQSTPLVSSTGNILGMISTHFSRPHRLNDRELRFIELLARQVADYLERKRAERATGLLAAIVASSDDAIVSKNLDGIIQSWNGGAESVFGYTAKEAVGQHITIIIPQDRLAEEDEILGRLRHGERIDHFQTVRRRKDGTLIDVSVTISPIRDSSGRVIGASKVARDITLQKEAEKKIRLADETMRLMKVQDEERRRIARDLHDSAGQTLTVLGLSLSQLVQNAEHVAPELAKEGRQIEEVVQQLHREIRTTSYLLHPPLLDEAGLTSALGWYVQGVAQRSGMAIELVFSDGFERLPADMELAIFRVVQECLTNIHRHSESKTAFIRIARENGSVCIEVRDEGKGISPGRMAEIEACGSGVGIAGIRERLRQFGGELKIVSNGSGTLVQAQVPLPAEATVPIQIEPLQATV